MSIIDNAAAAARAAAAAAAAAAKAAAEAAAKAAAEAAAKAAAEAAAKAAAEKKSTKPEKPVATKDEFTTEGAGAKNTLRLDGGNAPAELAPLTAKAETAKADGAGATEGTEPKPGALPEKPEDLPKLFPELKDKSTEDLKKTYESMKTLVEGKDFSEKATALGELSEQFPDTTKNMLEKLGVKDNKLAKLATNSDALKALGELTSKDSSTVDKAKAALELANAAGDIFKPEDLKGVLNTALNALPAGAKLAEAISTFMDPEKGAIDKAKASLALAESLKDFAGKEFPKLANDLRKLDGTFKAVGSAITLLDPDASLKDKALAAAQLAVEIPDLKKDLTAFKGVLEQFGVKNAGEVVEQAAVEAAVKGLAPEVAAKLTPEQLTSLKDLATKVGPEELEKVLGGITDPKALEGLTSQLTKLDGPAGKRLLTALGDMEHGALAKTLTDPKLVEQLGSMATKLDDEAMGIVGKLAKDMDADMLRTFLKFTDGVSGDLLNTGIKGIGPALTEGGGKLVGKTLKVLDDVLGKMGVTVGKEVAEKVFKNLAKIIPFAGAVPGLIDAAKYTKESAELRDQNKDLGYFALLGAKLNGADAVVGTVLSATGVGAAVDLGVGALFGVAELAFDVAYDAEKKKFEADPKGYEAPGWMKALNLAGAAAMGPAGAVELAAYYGPEGAAELAQWGIETGAKGAVDLAEKMGVTTAELAGDGLKGTAAFIRQMADVVRNPSKYGEAAVKAASDAFNTAIEKGGQIAEEAKKVLTGVIDEAKKLGQKGLETLQFIAQNPGEAAKMAVDGIKSVIDSGIDLATDAGKAVYKKAVETLDTLKAGWDKLTGAAKEKAQELITSAGNAIKGAVDKAVQLGEKGVELLAWAATNPGEAAEAAKKAIGDALAKGGEIAKKTWETIKGLGEKGMQLAESAIKGLKDLGGKAVETLKYIAENPGEAAAKVRDWAGQTLSDMARKGGEMAKEAATAIKDFVDRRLEWAKGFATDLLKEGVESFKEVAKAWGENLTEGGKEILSALKDLGAAGVDALKDLASVGGQLAEAAVGKLNDLAKAGIDAAKGALEGLARLGGEVGRLAGDAFNAVKNATNGEINIGPVHVDVNPFW
jgi:hypothetical protein